VQVDGHDVEHEAAIPVHLHELGALQLLQGALDAGYGHLRGVVQLARAGSYDARHEGAVGAGVHREVDQPPVGADLVLIEERPDDSLGDGVADAGHLLGHRRR